MLVRRRRPDQKSLSHLKTRLAPDCPQGNNTAFTITGLAGQSHRLTLRLQFVFPQLRQVTANLAEQSQSTIRIVRLERKRCSVQ